MLWFFRSGVLVLLDNFRDVTGHVHITCTVGVVPVEVHFEELFSFPIDGNILAVLFECVEKMWGVLLSNTFHAKVIHAQSKSVRAVCM